MAVVSVKILHNGWGASEDVGKKTTFTVVYLVEVDDKNDGALTVMDADDGTTRIPRRFETYAVGNDSDSFAFVKTKSPTPIDDRFWHVSVTFGPNEPAGEPDGRKLSGLDENGQPTDDPIKEITDVSIRIENVSRAAERGAYIGQVDLPAGGNPWDPGTFSAEGFRPGKPTVSLNADGDNQGRIVNGVPITNSVFTPFDPPPEIDYNRFRVTVGMNVDIFPSRILGLVNSVNSRAMTLDDGFGPFVFGFAQDCPEYTCRVMGTNASKRIKNGKTFWRLEIEYLIDYLFGWRLDILDRGYCEDSNNTVSEGATAKNNILDEKGNQIAEPVLLDGNGKLLDLETHSAAYLRYAVYPEVDFNAMNIARFDFIKREFTHDR